MRPASGVVVTSMPRRLNPAAIARLPFSSRWKRIVRGIGGPSPELLLLEGTGPPFRLHLANVPLAFEDVGVDLLAVLIIVGQGRVDVREREARIGRDDFIRAH